MRFAWIAEFSKMGLFSMGKDDCGFLEFIGIAWRGGFNIGNYGLHDGLLR